jgi:hypothetical protein
MKPLLSALAVGTLLAAATPAFAEWNSWGANGAAVSDYYGDSYGYVRGPHRYRHYSRPYSYANSSNRAYGSGYGNSYAFRYQRYRAPEGFVPNNYGSYCGQLPKAC